MANISAIKLPNGDTYVLKDNGALQLTGGQVTGPVTFGDSVSIDELIAGDLVVNGAGSFTNNLQVNTINGIAVGDSPKFTDTVTTISTTGNGNAITAISATNGVLTATKGTTFLTSYTETDPVFSASAAAGITATDISNWNSKTSNTGTITSVKTTAGQHTTINVTSGAVNFNVPTHTSHLTNDSGYLTSTDIDLDNYVPIEKTIGDTTYTYEIDYDEFSTLRQVRIEVFRDSDKNAALTLSGGNGTAILAGGKATEIYNVVTPTSNDMAANKKYVDDSIPKVYSSTNTGGYLTIATLPIYDGTVV